MMKTWKLWKLENYENFENSAWLETLKLMIRNFENSDKNIPSSNHSIATITNLESILLRDLWEGRE